MRINKSLYLFLGLFFIYSTIHAFQSKETEKKIRYPKTYKQAVDKVVASLSDKDKTLLQNFPKCALFGLRNTIPVGRFLKRKDHKFLKSCAKAIGKRYVHFEDASGVILAGSWDKLNSDLNLINFATVAPEEYFDSVWKTMNVGKQSKRLGYLASLPEWVYSSDVFFREEDPIRDTRLIQLAKELVLAKNEKSYLGLLYFCHYSPNQEEKESFLEDYYKNETSFIELPSYKNTYTDEEKVLSTDYTFNKISLKEFSLKCYGIIYDKSFESAADYEKFLMYCNSNYLAYWKFQKRLSSEDYRLLINQPRKLLEILILTNRYYYKDSGYHQLISSGDGDSDIDDFIHFIESKDSLSLTYPYHKRLGEYDNGDEAANKSIHALQFVSGKLSMEELFDIMDPKSIEDYNKTLKTDDFLEYKYLIGFIIASEYKRLLAYPDKNKIFEICLYYSEKEHVSWPFQYFLTDLLFQIDAKRAFDMFKVEFKENPTEGSFTRHAILSSIIAYDFEAHAAFIEEWYWMVQGKDFNHRPKEHEYILEMLKEKDQNTLALYSKIIQDVRYKE